MAAADLIHVTRWHNGEKSFSPFSDGEMARRHDAMQARMDHAGIDACLFTSYHNICYFSGFLYCKFGRRDGAVAGESAMALDSSSAATARPASLRVLVMGSLLVVVCFRGVG